MVGADGMLIVASALSQKANLAHEATGGKSVFRPRGFARLLAWAGAPALSVRPVMTHEALATYADGAAALGLPA